MTTLMLVDLQRGMCDDDGPAGAGGLAHSIRERGVLDRAAAVLEAARSGGWSVIHVHLAFEEGYVNRTNRTARFAGHESASRFLRGSVESEIRTEVGPRSGELVVAKGSVSPFASTALLPMLLARRETDLVVAGVATHLAVESAAREASDRGISVTVLEDACAAPVDAVHEHAVTVAIPSFAQVSTVDELLAARG
jgi:nicotinamidase-related amidase